MWFRKKPVEENLDKELRYHFDKLVRESIAEGVEPGEARRRARLEFGGVEQIKEDCRDVQGRWMEDFGKDLHYTARTLRRSPGFLGLWHHPSKSNDGRQAAARDRARSRTHARDRYPPGKLTGELHPHSFKS